MFGISYKINGKIKKEFFMHQGAMHDRIRRLKNFSSDVTEITILPNMVAPHEIKVS